MLERRHSIPVWSLSYFMLYMPWFIALENRNPLQCTIVQHQLDKLIPFCEYFIIPYLLWFFYVGAGLFYLMFTLPRKSYYRVCGVLFGGLTVCLVLYTFFYTGLRIRPWIDPEKNIFTHLVSLLWAADTSTNVCPSIHVYATLVMHRALDGRPLMQEHPLLRLGSTVLAVSIILSTMFLKQHSVIDVVCGFLLFGVMHFAVYGKLPAAAAQKRSWQQMGA